MSAFCIYKNTFLKANFNKCEYPFPFFHFLLMTFLWLYRMAFAFLSRFVLDVSVIMALTIISWKQNTHLYQRNRFHKLVKIVSRFYYRHKDLVYIYNSTCIYLIKRGIFHSCIYLDVIHKVHIWHSYTCKNTWTILLEELEDTKGAFRIEEEQTTQLAKAKT